MKLEDPEYGSHYGFDDEIEFDTQASSQWDSFGVSKNSSLPNTNKNTPTQLTSCTSQPASPTTEQTQRSMPFKPPNQPSISQH
ncbi:hypothetical protein VN97_g10043 [Penicillium thymicola]|uniref:Uncharacterized protein n=1 Tax=Penicillium thymicola TaxID=293382 RepID=A0AAI9TAU9_PENTH|nr:hypothetical protein VN97_g10043 [Penicillium thymicola]